MLHSDNGKSYFKNIIEAFRLKNYISYIATAVALLVFSVLYYTGLQSRSLTTLLMQIGYSVILSVSLNLVVGSLGELSLGHAGFMCIGAYLGTFVSNYLLAYVTPVAVCLAISMLAGGLAAGIFGLLVGLPALRLRGDYLAIVTLAFGEIVRNLCRNIPIFGGAQGLVSDYYSVLLSGDSPPLFIVAFSVVLLMLSLIQNLIRSKHGRAITAIRDSEIAARSMGINVTYYKLLVFVLSAFFAGIAGVIYAASFSPVSYSSFSYNYSIEILVMVVLGGMGSVGGSIIAATFITVINFVLVSEFSGEMFAVKNIVYALILIVIIIYKNSPRFKPLRDKKLIARLLRRGELKAGE